MYTDTKTSCESVTTAAKANDDPELVALHRSFRIQKDRLLAGAWTGVTPVPRSPMTLMSHSQQQASAMWWQA
jgi:hypothetical protein